MKQVDINCDVGEGLDNEALIFIYISRCNLACGGHAGDEDTIRKVMQLAKKHNVIVGAHPSYPDKENFGRKVLDISTHDLIDSITNQLTTFYKIAEEEKIHIDHIKPHGALYNEAAKNKKVAEAVISAIKKTKLFNTTKLMTPHNSVIANIAKTNNIETLYEGFVDRNYNENLSLVSRNQEHAIIEDPENAIVHLSRMINGNILTVTGKTIPIKASSFCIHGDNRNVIAILKHLHAELPAIGYTILK